jgi:hypothetical protein
MRSTYNSQEVFHTRTKIMRRWEVSRPVFFQLIRRHGVKPYLIGSRHKYKMSDIARIEAAECDKPTPKQINDRANAMREDARAAA